MDIIPEPHSKRQRLADVVPLRTPFVIFLDVCDRCNFRCNFCPCNNSNEAIKSRRKTMNFELFKKIIDDMSEFNTKIRVVNLYAYGEPLLNPYFGDMLKYLKNKDVCNEIRVTSNGSLLTDELCEKMVENGLDMFRLSLYGLSDEEYLVNTGVNIDYSKLKSNIAYLYELNKKNEGSLKISLKAASSFINSEKKLHQLYADFSVITDYLYVENIEEVWPEFLLFNKYENLSYAPRKYAQEEQSSLCSYLFTTMMIYSNGDVGICDVDWKHETKYGSALNDSIVNLWNGNTLRNLRLKFCQNPVPPIDFCKSCKKIFDDNLDNDREKIMKRILVDI